MITTNLNKPRAWYDVSPPIAATIVIFCLLAIGLMVGRIRSTPSVLLQPTPALDPIIIIASPLPQGIPPTAVPVQVAALPPNALRRAVVAYDSPNGSAIGAIEQGRPYSVLARYGSDWLQTDVQGSGVVWLKADQVLDLPDGLADLEPPPQPVIVERPVIVYQQTEQAAPTMSERTQAIPLAAAAVLDRNAWAAMAATARAGR